MTHPYFLLLYKIILTENANIHRNPYIIASGVTEDFNSANLSFTLTPSQYINLPHTVLNCPISCFIDAESKKKLENEKNP